MSCVTSPWTPGRDGERGANRKYWNFLKTIVTVSVYKDKIFFEIWKCKTRASQIFPDTHIIAVPTDKSRARSGAKYANYGPCMIRNLGIVKKANLLVTQTQKNLWSSNQTSRIALTDDFLMPISATSVTNMSLSKLQQQRIDQSWSALIYHLI